MTPIIAMRLPPGQAPARSWIVLLTSSWLGFLAAVFFNQLLVWNVPVVMVLLPVTFLCAMVVSALAYRAAWRKPSVPLGLVVLVAFFGSPLLALSLNMDPAFDSLWFRLNERRLAHVLALAQGDFKDELADSKEVSLPESLSDLAWSGRITSAGSCDGSFIPYLPQFYPPIGGNWSEGFAYLECSDAKALHDNGLRYAQHAGGGWWWVRRE
jgi:hypothetical protein